MPTALKVKFQHEAAELWEGYQVSTCAVERRRFQVLALLAEGRTSACARQLGPRRSGYRATRGSSVASVHPARSPLPS